MKAEAEIGMKLPQARKYQEPSKLGEAGRIPLRALGEHLALPTPAFQTSSLHNYERIHFSGGKPPIL